MLDIATKEKDIYMPAPILSSTQEKILEELMQKSFGAKFLYAPDKYRRGSKTDEPCDLFWFGNNILVLFYATAGEKSLKSQDDHNLKQARRWIRYWSSQKNLPLIGKNRFGEKKCIFKSEVKTLINISVISHRTGIVFFEEKHLQIHGFTCSVPENLIHEIAKLNGTVIDLLEIIRDFSGNFSRHITRHGVLGEERLNLILTKKASQPQTILRRNNFDISYLDSNFEIIKRMIEFNRLSAPFEGAIHGDEISQEIWSSYFSDLSAADYLIIAMTAKRAIEKTENGKYSFCMSTDGLHLNWVIVAIELLAKNLEELLINTQKILVEKNKQNLPRIIYGQPRDISDYRQPLSFVLPSERLPSQAEKISEQICNRLNLIKF